MAPEMSQLEPAYPRSMVLTRQVLADIDDGCFDVDPSLESAAHVAS